MLAYTAVACLFATLLVGCVAGPALPPTTADAPLPHIVGAAGYGRGFLDLLSGDFVETPETLEVQIVVSKLDAATISDELRTAGIEEAYIGACWGPYDGGGHAECAGVTIRASDIQPVRGAYEVSRPAQDGCNEWWWCAWEVPAWVDGVLPATIHIQVPRTLIAFDKVGDQLAAPVLVARAYQSIDEAATGRGTIVSACVEENCVRRSVNRGAGSSEGDQAGPGGPVTFELAAQDSPLSSPRTVLVDFTHDIQAGGAYRPDLDIVAVAIEETQTEIAYVVTVASLPNAPTHSFDMEVAVDGHVYESWYRVLEGNVMDVGGGHCSDFECTGWDEHPATATLHPGTPGQIRVAMPWSGLPEARKGSLVTLASVDLGEWSEWVGEPGPLDDVTGNQLNFFVTNHGAWDIAYLAQPYALAVGKP